MARRTWVIGLMLVWTSESGAADPQQAAAQQPQAQRKSAADHATVEGDAARSATATAMGKRRITWPGHDPRGHGPAAQRLVAQAGRAGRRSWAICPVQIAVHPSQPILAILHAGYGEHEVVTVDGVERARSSAGSRCPPAFAGLVWSADGKRLFAGGGFDDRDLSVRPRRRAALEQDRLRVSRPQGVPGAASPRTGKKPRSFSDAGRAGDHQGRQDALCRRGVRPLAWAGSTPSRARFRARSPSRPTAIPTAWRSTSRASGFTSASGARPRSPSSTPTTFEVVGHWTDRGAPQRDAPGAQGGKILYVANANRNTVSVIDTEAGKPIETIGTAIDPKAPSGQHAQLAGPLARRVDAVRRQRQHQ